MEPFTQGLVSGVIATSGVLLSCFSCFYLLKKQRTEPIISKTTVPSGGPAYGKKNPSKRTPKAVTELHEWQAEQENEG